MAPTTTTSKFTVETVLPLEHSNSGKKVSIQFDSILATESIFRFDSAIW